MSKIEVYWKRGLQHSYLVSERQSRKYKIRQVWIYDREKVTDGGSSGDAWSLGFLVPKTVWGYAGFDITKAESVIQNQSFVVLTQEAYKKWRSGRPKKPSRWRRASQFIQSAEGYTPLSWKEQHADEAFIRCPMR